LLSTVDSVTEMSIHASRIALLHVIMVLQAGQPLLHPLNQTFFAQCCTLGYFVRSEKSAEKKIPYAAYCEYKRCMPPSHKPLYEYNPRFSTFQVNNVAREMATNLKVMFKTEFLKRHLFWCSRIVESVSLIFGDDDDFSLVVAEANTDNNASTSSSSSSSSSSTTANKDKKKKRDKAQIEADKMKRSERWKVVQWLFQQTVQTDAVSLDPVVLNRDADAALSHLSLVWTVQLRNVVVAAIIHCRSTIPAEVRPIRYGDLVNQSKVHRYMPWMYQLLKHRIEHNASHPDQRQQWRLFTLMPVRGYDRCYVSISTTDLTTFAFHHRHLLPGVSDHLGPSDDGPSNEIGEVRKYVQEHTVDKLWRHMFRIDDLESKKPKEQRTRAFAYSIRTDGISVSTLWSKVEPGGSAAALPSADDDNDDEKSSTDVISLDYDQDQPIRIIPSLADKRVIGIDPGKKSIFTAAESDDSAAGADKHIVRAYSKARYDHESGAKEAKKNREKWKKKTEQETPGYSKWLD
jgi:hypothetical protein